MNEKDFYDLFSDKLRGLSPPNVSDQDWPGLSTRLDAFDRRRFRRQWAPWLAVLAALLLLSNGLWWWYWQHSVGTLEKKWVQWREQQAPAFAGRDTVIQREVIYRYDTLYRTVYVRERGWSTETAAFTGPFREGGARSGGQLTSGREETGFVQKPAPTEGETAESAPGFEREGPGMVISARSPAKKLTLAALPATSPDNLPYPGAPYPLPFMDPVMQPAAPAEKESVFLPRSFRLGIGGGALIPVDGSLSNRGGYAVSAIGEIGFTEAVSLVLEAAYGGLTFRGYTLDNQLGLPPITPPGDDYFLKYLETHEAPKPVVRFTAGMQYRLNPRGIWQPILGIGYASLFQPGYNLEVEFVDRRYGREISRNLLVPAAGRPLSMLDLRFGVAWAASSHWALRVGGIYNRKLDRAPGIPAFFSLQGGVMYQF